MDISTNALSSAIGTIQSGQRRVEQAAGEIAGSAAHAAQPPVTALDPAPRSEAGTAPELEQSLVALRVGQHEAQAGARLLATADEVLGTLIDTSA